MPPGVLACRALCILAIVKVRLCGPPQLCEKGHFVYRTISCGLLVRVLICLDRLEAVP